MNYTVVYGQSTAIKGAITKLESEMNNIIKKGYKPQGGVSVSENESGWIIVCQAMVKE